MQSYVWITFFGTYIKCLQYFAISPYSPHNFKSFISLTMLGFHSEFRAVKFFFLLQFPEKNGNLPNIYESYALSHKPKLFTKKKNNVQSLFSSDSLCVLRIQTSQNIITVSTENGGEHPTLM